VGGEEGCAGRGDGVRTVTLGGLDRSGERATDGIGAGIGQQRRDVQERRDVRAG
jgi:hypothetical protein